MTFQEWYDSLPLNLPHGHVAQMKMAWHAAVGACREACLEVGKDAQEAAKAKDATDYVAGYQDAAVDCDEALRQFAADGGQEPK